MGGVKLRATRQSNPGLEAKTAKVITARVREDHYISMVGCFCQLESTKCLLVYGTSDQLLGGCIGGETAHLCRGERSLLQVLA